MDSSKILTFFNMELDTFIIVVSIMTVILIITLFFLLLDYIKIRKRYMEFMTGETGKNLEYTIYKRFRDIEKLKEGQKDNDDQIEIIYDMVRKSYNRIGIHHYNAFNHSKSVNGGSISFAMALLNSSYNGIILNVIHNRAGCYIYLKEIKGGECEIALSEEETKALDIAMDNGNAKLQKVNTEDKSEEKIGESSEKNQVEKTEDNPKIGSGDNQEDKTGEKPEKGLEENQNR